VPDLQRIELPLDQRRGLVLFKAEFGVPMNRAAQLDDSSNERLVDLDSHSKRS